MESMCDDIFFEILKLLTLEDQMNIFIAIPEREQTIEEYWRCNFRRKISLNLREPHLSAKRFRQLLKAVHNTVEIVKLEYLHPSHYEVLCAFTFPKVEDFEFRTVSLKDDDILKLAATFPALRKFNPMGTFSGKYMGHLWPELKELKLHRIVEIEGQYLYEIISKLELEVFTINTDCGTMDELLDYLIDLKRRNDTTPPMEIRNLPQLQELSFFDFGRYSRYGKDLVCVLSSEPWNTDYEIYNPFHKQWNLLCLSVQRYSACELVRINFGTLSTVIIKNSRFDFEEDFEDILYASRNLQLLSFEKCEMDFKTIDIDVERLVKNRRTTLTLNFFENVCCYEYNNPRPCVIQQRGSDNSLLRITNEKHFSCRDDPYDATLKMNAN